MANRSPLPRQTAGLVIAGAVAVLLIAGAIAKATGGVPDGDVGKIGKVGNISKTTFGHWYTIVNNSQQSQPGAKKSKVPPPLNTPQGKALMAQVMEFLVTGDWIIGEAAERGVSVSDAEVQRRFEETKKQSFPKEAQYQKFLKQSGQSQQDILFRVKLEVLSGKIRDQVTKGAATVSDGQAQDYYNKNKSQFSQPEQRDIQRVVTKTEAKAKQAQSALQSGQSFASVAKKFTTDPTAKSNGGKLAGVTKGTQDPLLEAAIFKAGKGQLEGPVKTTQGFVVFKVTRVQKGTQQSFDQSKAGIKQLLASQNQQSKLDQFQKTFKAKWRQRTLCADGYVVPDCANGREDTGQPTPPPPPGAKKQLPGSGKGAPPALDNPSSPAAPGASPTVFNLAGSGPGGPVLQPAQPASPGVSGAPAGISPHPGTGGPGSTLPLALGGAPQKGAAAPAAGGLPPGLGTAPPGGGTAPPGGGTSSP